MYSKSYSFYSHVRDPVRLHLRVNSVKIIKLKDLIDYVVDKSSAFEITLGFSLPLFYLALYKCEKDLIFELNPHNLDLSRIWCLGLSALS